MAKSKSKSVDRRNFLKGAAAGAAVLAAAPGIVAAQPLQPRRGAPPPPMSPEAEVGTPAHAELLTLDRAGSDFMVDVMWRRRRASN